MSYHVLQRPRRNPKKGVKYIIYDDVEFLKVCVAYDPTIAQELAGYLTDRARAKGQPFIPKPFRA